MELSSNLSEKLLYDDPQYKEDENYNKPNRIEYMDNIANIHKKKNFEEIDTDKFEDNKKTLLNKKLKNKKNVKFGKISKKEVNKSKVLKLKVITHFLLVILTIIQTLLILNPITTYLRAQEKIFYNVFLQKSPKEQTDFSKVLYLYNIDELRNHFKKTIENFFNLEKFLFNRISYIRNYTVVEFFYFEDKLMNNLNKQLFLTNETLLSSPNINDLSIYNLNDYLDFNSTHDFIDNKVTNYKITNERFGPFALDNKSLKIFLNDVKNFRVHFRFHVYTIDEISGFEKCNEWVN